jgi:hypothetical protein
VGKVLEMGSGAMEVEGVSGRCNRWKGVLLEKLEMVSAGGLDIISVGCCWVDNIGHLSSG